MSENDTGMEHQSFITSAITQVVAGVEEARTQLLSHEGGAKVNPQTRVLNDQRPCPISFDVAVSASSKTDKGGKGGIRVLSLELGGHAGSEVRTETISRIQFEVPVALPRSEPEKSEMPKVPSGNIYT